MVAVDTLGAKVIPFVDTTETVALFVVSPDAVLRNAVKLTTMPVLEPMLNGPAFDQTILPATGSRRLSAGTALEYAR